MGAVTAEVASSSLVVPAILSKGVTGRDTGNSNPRLNPQLLIHRSAHPHSVQEFALCCSCFVAVFLRAQIESGLNLAVTQDSLNGFRFAGITGHPALVPQHLIFLRNKVPSLQ